MVVKLTDVAKKAGVSPTTVSRVINNYGSLSQKNNRQGSHSNEGAELSAEFLGTFTAGEKYTINWFDFPNRRQPFFWRAC